MMEPYFCKGCGCLSFIASSQEYEICICGEECKRISWKLAKSIEQTLSEVKPQNIRFAQL